jgi:hypothetical protein
MHRLQDDQPVVVHLVRRFLGFLTARPLTPSEQQHVRLLLRPPLARAFFAQRYEDQRHAFEVQQRSASDASWEAALLHDIGKTESDLGAVSRSLATLWHGLGLPTSNRWATYIDHGALGADALTQLDASELAIAFTRHHPGPAPDGIDPDVWRALEEADDA